MGDDYVMEINGNRVCLRDWQFKDLDVYKYWMQPEHQWHKLDGPYYKKLNSEQILERIEKIRKRIQNKDFPNPRVMIVVADLKTDEMIGLVNWYWQSKETNWVSVGISIFNPDYWRKGIGYETLGLWSEYLFKEMSKIVRLDLRTWSGNKGMIKLAEKLGFKLEACFRKARIVDGNYYDGIGYGILREEWNEMHPSSFSMDKIH